MINITTTESISSLEHFPVLSEAKNMRRKTPQVAENKYNNENTVNFWDDSEYKKFEKNYICKSIKNGVDCPYGRKCNCAHYRDELVIKNCNYGDRCNRIKLLKNGKMKNVDAVNFCMFLHPSEDETSYFSRLGIKEEMLVRPVKDPLTLHYTKMCNSYFDKIECEQKDECTYAHSVDQLKVSPCNFKEKCNHVVKTDSGEYIMADGTKKICRYLHPDESKENYEKRVVSNMKKIEPRARVEKPKSKLLGVKKETKDGIVLNVPVDMAVEMLNTVIKSGQKNVQVNTF